MEEGNITIVITPTLGIAILGMTSLFLFGFLVYSLLLCPLFSRNSSSQILYSADREAVELSRKNKKRANTYPKGYPEGWFSLCRSEDVKKGQVKYFEACGEEFACYRGEDGEIRILNAYCTHLGANLGIGGKVIGNSLECQFHLWKFEGSGECSSIPYCSKIPDSAHSRNWVSQEYHGLVFFFYSLNPENRASPPYPLVPVKEIVEEGHVLRGEKSFKVNMHIQEFAENSVDFQHFSPLHGKMNFPFTEVNIPYLDIRHVARWEQDEKHGHVTRFFDHASLEIWGKEIPHSQADASITFQGPAGVVIFSFVTEMGKIEILQTHTPVSPMELKVGFRWFADKKIPRILVGYVVGNWISQWKRDVMVWENKIYLRKPVLVKGDGPVMKLRRWFSQFYQHNVDYQTEW